MKYLKMLGLAAVGACALMAFVGAGSASATILTCDGGTCAVGTVIHAENENGHVTLHPIIGDIQCASTVEGKITNAGSSTTTVEGSVSSLLFVGCTNGATAHTIKGGSLILHTGTNQNTEGTVTSVGAEVTIEAFGFHCIFGTGTGVDIGLFTGSEKTGTNATFDIAATIPRIGGRSGAFCGSSAQWTGNYKITKPNPLNIH